MKSTKRPGSSMFIATVESSSESVGDPATICWKRVRTLRCSASTSEPLGGMDSDTGSTRHRIKGVNWVNSVSRTRSRPSAKTKRLWLGILTTLWTTASVPTVYRSVGWGESTRASRCATTTMVLSSPKELINWTELSRPTVKGKTAWGKRTVSRTGRIGSERSSWGESLIFGVRSGRDGCAMFLLECNSLKFLDDDVLRKDSASLVGSPQGVG